jgi:hypothetical protein
MTAAILLALCAVSDTPRPVSARQALQPFNALIGSWKGTGSPEGTREERQKGFWTETIRWTWQFKGDDAWLTADIDKGKHFTSGELRYNAGKETYQLSLMTPDKQTLTFSGTFKDKVLTLDRADPAANEDQRLVITLLHHNRYLYRFETKPAGSAVGYTRKYQVGATKEGVAFADVPRGPECIVTGGLGTSKVTHNGKEYYVCCSGCRDAFKDDPEKYIKEAEARAKEKK